MPPLWSRRVLWQHASCMCFSHRAWGLPSMSTSDPPLETVVAVPAEPPDGGFGQGEEPYLVVCAGIAGLILA
ncbi:MAG: hypothetical protein QOI39_2736 [Mycobacterium sp.]|nr:hypothetical protein [Mycobacterium sp.]